MNSKVIILIIVVFAIFLSGCVENKPSNQVVVGSNLTGTYITTDSTSTNINLQPGEKIYYIDGRNFFNDYEEDSVAEHIIEFSNTHNVTRVQSGFNSNGKKAGAYIIYRE